MVQAGVLSGPIDRSSAQAMIQLLEARGIYADVKARPNPYMVETVFGRILVCVSRLPVTPLKESVCGMWCSLA
ncbi:unnamed protein product [Eruca vesicaria subsp. sativa]|uniref:Uncharacterized protein n=1 Tax=Eruca vesicaria subsp. sativa TaxID=29727 RepID=A0ABC8K7S3_ERUVS|nr:unnamed protein product [Eruca vesicaria subsp. sativa]